MRRDPLSPSRVQPPKELSSRTTLALSSDHWLLFARSGSSHRRTKPSGRWREISARRLGLRPLPGRSLHPQQGRRHQSPAPPAMCAPFVVNKHMTRKEKQEQKVHLFFRLALSFSFFCATINTSKYLRRNPVSSASYYITCVHLYYVVLSRECRPWQGLIGEGNLNGSRPWIDRRLAEEQSRL